MHRVTGAPLTGWAEVEQSIAVILTTPIGSRVMRREFGSEVMELIDRPMTADVVLALYVAVAYSIARWEPRFRLVGVEMAEPGHEGGVIIMLRGDYGGSLRDTAIALGLAA